MAVATLVALAALLGRRFLRRPPHAPRTAEDLLTPLLIGLVILLALLAEAAHLAAELARGGLPEDLRASRPVASTLAAPLAGLDGLLPLADLADGLSWGHSLLAWAFVASLGWTKLRHVLLGPTNIFFRRLTPPSLPLLDLESGQLGLAKLQDLTWKQLLDLDACTRCGMCLQACPALATGKPLQPREVIQGLQRGLPKIGRSGELPATSIFDLVSPEAAWACVACYACEDACPVLVEIPDKLLGMRRNLAMGRQEMPERVQGVLHSLEVRGHPFPGLQASTRTAWAAGLGVKTLAEAPDAEYLLWVGCAGALVESNVPATRALVRLLQRAGVSFAILGDEEVCTGDPARRLGAEHLFLLLAEQNRATFERYGVKKVIARCAHCFNSLRNDYAQLGLELEVVHHTELLAELLAAGRLPPMAATARRVTYHDPCYLSRANGVFEPPRKALRSVPGLAVVEMGRNRAGSFCCGGGGGHALTGDDGPRKINHKRAAQALATQPDVIAVGCPYCYQMLGDGLGALDARQVAVRDVAEVLADALEDGPPG